MKVLIIFSMAHISIILITFGYFYDQFDTTINPENMDTVVYFIDGRSPSKMYGDFVFSRDISLKFVLYSVKVLVS